MVEGFEVIYNGVLFKPNSSKINRTYKVYKKDNLLKWELTQGQFGLFDLNDLDSLLQQNWRAQLDKTISNPDMYYVLTGHDIGEVIAAHRYLAGLEFGNPITVDHKNRQGLDNRKQNLRLATKEQQVLNQQRQGFKNGDPESFSCEYRGVIQRSDNGKFRVRGSVLGVQYNLGHFSDPVKAAETWDEFLFERFKNHNPLVGLDMNGIKSEPTLNFIQFNFPERLGLCTTQK